MPERRRREVHGWRHTARVRVWDCGSRMVPRNLTWPTGFVHLPKTEGGAFSTFGSHLLEQLRSKTGRDIVERPDSRRIFRCVLSFVLFVFSLFLVCCLVLLIVFCCVVALFVVTFDLGKSPLVQKRNQNPPKPERNPQASIKNVGYKRKRN